MSRNAAEIKVGQKLKVLKPILQSDNTGRYIVPEGSIVKVEKITPKNSEFSALIMLRLISDIQMPKDADRQALPVGTRLFSLYSPEDLNGASLFEAIEEAE